MQRDTKHSRHTERERKYPVTNLNELSCKKDNYAEITNQLDCFGSKEPHNDYNSSYSRHSECNEESHSCCNLRGYFAYAQYDVKEHNVGSKRRKVAFTLAEVLITLGIIGVVAALTLPTLIQNHQKQVLATGAKKGLNIVANLVNKLQAEEGVSNYEESSLFTDAICAHNEVYDYEAGQIVNKNGCEDIYGNPSLITKIISKNLKTVKICQGEDCDIKYIISGGIRDGKLNNSYTDRKILNKSSSDVWSIVSGFYTSDGMIIYVFPSAQGISFWFDTNGEKAPNTYGRDLFALKYCINNKGIRYSSYGDACTSNDPYYNYINSPGEPLVHLMSNGWKLDY